MAFRSRMVNHYFGAEDELRQVKERLAELEQKTAKKNVIVLRSVPRTEVKEEVRRILTEDGTVLYSDIIRRTRVCPALVMDVYDELAAER
jgi:hypothetical protein